MALQPRKLLKRAATTAVGALVILMLVLYFPKPIFHLALLGFAVVGALELRTMSAGFDAKLFITPVVLTVFLGQATLYWNALELAWLPFVATAIACLMSLGPGTRVENSLTSVGATLLGCAYLGLSLIGLSYIFSIESSAGEERGRYLVLFCFFVVWMGDSFAYVFGSLFGKHKIAKIVSPNKSLEGAIANLIGNSVAMVVGKATFFPELTWPFVILLALVFFTLGLFGDLAESAWKRGSAIKDSGSIFPGHGGVLDRVDSIFLTAPVFYWVMQYLTT